jgi:hypothetical protein
MTLLEAIKTRHSIRRYKDIPLPDDIVQVQQDKITEIYEKANLHVQIITNEPKAFKGIFAYGKFSGVNNYFVMAGKKSQGLDERVDYYGERLVLLAQQLGLNTCWAGLSYQQVNNTYVLIEGEKIACYIAIGCGEAQGVTHKGKYLRDISNASDITPLWFNRAIEAVSLASTSVNQQKFYFKYKEMKDSKHSVLAKRAFSMVGYTEMDFGIAKLHFEIGADTNNFEWM